MQSGISASEELVSQFNNLLSGNDFGLLATISSEALQPLTLLSPSSPSSSFSSNLSVLAPHLKPNEALYIILKRHPTAPRLVAVTYVPDSAPVRQKMLFASTRLTLVRELGSEHFRETIFATMPAELTPAGFAKHDAHAALGAPLTEEEESLSAVKKAEQEAGQGTGTREIHLSKSLAMTVQDDAQRAMKEIAEGAGRVLAMMKVNPESEMVELVPDNSAPSTIAELSQAISSTEQRFTFYRYAHSYGGEEFNSVLFLYTHPETEERMPIKQRMLYPLVKRVVLQVGSECGLVIDKKFEVESPSEITEESVMSELHPKAQVKQGFSRPKRPGR